MKCTRVPHRLQVESGRVGDFKGIYKDLRESLPLSEGVSQIKGEWEISKESTRTRRPMPLPHHPPTSSSTHASSSYDNPAPHATQRAPQSSRAAECIISTAHRPSQTQRSSQTQCCSSSRLPTRRAVAEQANCSAHYPLLPPSQFARVSSHSRHLSPGSWSPPTCFCSGQHFQGSATQVSFRCWRRHLRIACCCLGSGARMIVCGRKRARRKRSRCLLGSSRRLHGSCMHCGAA